MPVVVACGGVSRASSRYQFVIRRVDELVGVRHTPVMAAAARIALLGPLAIDGGDVSLGPRDRVVLTALATRAGEVVSAEQLADALWGEQPPASWSKVVAGCVSRLRRALGAEAIETTSHGYRLAMRPTTWTSPASSSRWARGVSC